MNRHPRRCWRRRARRVVYCTVAFGLALLLLDVLFPPPLPDVSGQGTVVVADDGRPLRAFAGADGVWRRPVTIEQVSPLYLEALLAYEDRWFRHHPGINPAALLRAAWQGLRHGRVVSGGSTLTMQVARILEPDAGSQRLIGKLRQGLRALQLEWRLDKQQILEIYLNHAPFGGPVEGIGAASWAWLGKPPDQLSHAEAALLAVLPQAPSRNRPDRHADRARRARDKVLDRLQASGRWPAATIQAARGEAVVARQLRPPLHAALLAERLRRQAPTVPIIATLIDADLQQALEARLTTWLERLPVATSAAVLVMDNDSLAVRAYLGSGRYADPRRLGHVDMVRAPRSPGSTLKPLLYGLALDDGLIHSESLLVDAPQAFDGYRPANFDSGFRGPVGAAEALRLSLNVPSVELLERLGPARFAARLRHAGVQLRLPRGGEPNLAMILGGTATTLEELVAGYSALGRGGVAGWPRYRPDDGLRERRLLSAGAAFIVGTMLDQPAAPGSAGDALARRPALVAKTGTSWGYRDAWAIGVEPRWTIGVWIGRPDGTPLPGQYGAVTALPLLRAIAASLPRQGRREFARPDTVALRTVCWPTGVASDGKQPCPQPRPAWVLDGVVPPTVDRLAPNAPRSIAIWIDPQGRRRLPGCADGLPLQQLQLARWPLLAAPWLTANQRRQVAPPAWAPGCGDPGSGAAAGMHLVGLHDGVTLKSAPGGSGQVAVSASAVGGDGEIWWLVDDRLAGTTRSGDAQVLDFPGTGRYRVVALDRHGNHALARIRVLP